MLFAHNLVPENMLLAGRGPKLEYKLLYNVFGRTLRTCRSYLESIRN